VLVITHDDRYFHTADRVIHMDNGRIVERPGIHSSSSRSHHSLEYQIDSGHGVSTVK
jgi:ABC-type siderophore export system fused ATPase/permease subunit